MIRVAIVGTGSIAHSHMETYCKLAERCCVVALVDIVPGKARRFMEEFHLDCDVYENHEDILPRTDIDLVDVCTPPYVHASISINCLRSGKNVVCEKPMAASLEECDAMLRARDESGKKLSIIAQNRFRQPIADLKALLDSGFTFHVDSPTNQLFPIFTDEQWEKIEELGFKLEFNGRLDEEHVVLRVCTSWCTPDEYVDKFIEALKEL